MTEDKGVQSIDRALDIIEAVAEAGRPMGLTEIANQIWRHIWAFWTENMWST